MRRRAFLSLFDFFLTFDDEKEDEEGLLCLLSFLSLSLSFFERNFMKSKTLNRWNVFRVSMKFLSLFFVLVFHRATIFVFFLCIFCRILFFSSLTKKKVFRAWWCPNRLVVRHHHR